jgi:hypothetical protein
MADPPEPAASYQRCTCLLTLCFAAIWIARAFFAAARILQSACENPRSFDLSQSS